VYNIQQSQVDLLTLDEFTGDEVPVVLDGDTFIFRIKTNQNVEKKAAIKAPSKVQVRVDPGAVSNAVHVMSSELEAEVAIAVSKAVDNTSVDAEVQKIIAQKVQVQYAAQIQEKISKTALGAVSKLELVARGATDGDANDAFYASEASVAGADQAAAPAAMAGTPQSRAARSEGSTYSLPPRGPAMGEGLARDGTSPMGNLEDELGRLHEMQRREKDSRGREGDEGGPSPKGRRTGQTQSPSGKGKGSGSMDLSGGLDDM
jgi:hypothetical protein